jgi:hypothetical protein
MASKMFKKYDFVLEKVFSEQKTTIFSIKLNSLLIKSIVLMVRKIFSRMKSTNEKSLRSNDRVYVSLV